MNSSREAFRHEPLDHTIPSIRVLQILPDLLPDGMIQCLMINTTVESKYYCLSYVWGSAVDQRTILINGKLFDVRRNLYDFLSTIQRRTSDPLSIWIDALSIDQEDTTERNHQVQQMGSIYSQASHVYIWLGQRQTVPLADIMAQMNPPSCWNLALNMPPGTDLQSYRRGTMDHDVFENEYWGRAWVTQEILLAPYISIVLSHVTLRFQEFLWALGYTTGSPRWVNFDPGDNSRYELRDWTHHTMQPLLRTRAMKRTLQLAEFRYLLPLLERFRTMQCMNTRDRVFSLLALCDEGPSIQVDYGSSHKALAYHILSKCKHARCICSIHLIGATLSYKDWVTSVPKARGWYVEVDLHDGHSFFSTERSEGLWKVQGNSSVQTTGAFPGTQLTVSLWHVPLRSYCWTTAHVLGQLKVLVSGMTSVHPAKEEAPAYFTGEEIHVPEGLAGSLIEGEHQAERRAHELRMYANGFSFVSPAKIRVSMDIIWKILAGLGRVEDLCARAAASMDDHITTVFSVAYGHWNVAQTKMRQERGQDAR